MSGHTKWSELQDELRTKPGAAELIARAREEQADELRLHDEQGRAPSPRESESPIG